MLGISCNTGIKGANILIFKPGSKKKREPNQLKKISIFGIIFLKSFSTRSKMRSGVTQSNH